MSVARCQREIDAREFSEWIADWEIEHWDHRENERAALICREIVNSSWSPPKVPAQIAHFMPGPRKEQQRQTVQEAKAQWGKAVANWPAPKKHKPGR